MFANHKWKFLVENARQLKKKKKKLEIPADRIEHSNIKEESERPVRARSSGQNKVLSVPEAGSSGGVRLRWLLLGGLSVQREEASLLTAPAGGTRSIYRKFKSRM